MNGILNVEGAIDQVCDANQIRSGLRLSGNHRNKSLGGALLVNIDYVKSPLSDGRVIEVNVSGLPGLCSTFHR